MQLLSAYLQRSNNTSEIKKDNDSKPIVEDNLHDINNIQDVG